MGLQTRTLGRRLLVGGLGVHRGLLLFATIGKLGKVAIVVCNDARNGNGQLACVLRGTACISQLVRTGLHLLVEDGGLGALRLLDQLLIEQLQDVVADRIELRLNLDLVGADEVSIGRALLGLLILDRADDAQRRAPGAHHVLVRDRDQVALHAKGWNGVRE